MSLTAPRVGTAPGALPVLGHAWELRTRPLEFLAALPAHGDLVEIRLGPSPGYVVCAPELLRHVLADSRTFDKGGPFFDKARALFGDSLAMARWAQHRWQRRQLQPAFQTARIAGYAEVMGEEVARMTRSWRAGSTVGLVDALNALALRIVTRSVLAAAAEDRAVAEFQRSLPPAVEGLYRRTLTPVPLLHSLPTPGNLRYFRARRRIRRATDDVIRAQRAAPPDDGGLVSLLLSARHGEHDGPLSDADIRDQLIVMIGAGSDTTANALAFAYWLLAGHPAAEERLHQELDDVLKGRPARFDDLDSLPYTRSVVSETLRLYPPGWFFTRATTAETELAGRRLPSGTTVLYSPYILHRHPGLFPEPERFDPDRWLPERADGTPRGALVPFGGGSRKCIGEQFALTEMALALAGISARWALRPARGTRLTPRALGTLSPGPLSMVPRPRKEAPGHG
ncbi:cytochrome P450 [Streptomyces boncukensis]|uniref:Cytochrome P450 n=1 Tax=Streptomyces boncukensis TaxID=2711219 RepID=A0A6G4X1L0_9ACTN|nr:cytochrome P450 [Streptomyces boncukensis]NGO71429.1 cytochrome P450 [Streptomyces boncukensis]